MSLKSTAIELYKQGYSCSESIIRAVYECKIIDHSLDIQLLDYMVLPFSAGMGSGCLCGAVAGAQMAIGLALSHKNSDITSADIKLSAKNFIEKFKEKRKVTCCKALSAGYEFHSPERRDNCANIVGDVAEILEDHIK